MLLLPINKINMIKTYSFIAFFFFFGYAFCQTNDVKALTKKDTVLIVQNPDASMLNQEINNKEISAIIAKKPLVVSEVVPNETVNKEATKKKKVFTIKD